MDKWAQAVQAAESTIEDNLSNIKSASIWLVGGIVDGKETGEIALNARLDYHDGEQEKIRYNIPKSILDELDTEKAMMGYVVEYLINHLILTQYFAKFDS